MFLATLPADIRLLKSITKHSAVPDGTPSQEAYHAIEAHLRLFLSNNSFTRVPSGILVLTNLRVLSLRQNRIASLPSGFRNLVRLCSLNISSNKLETLPLEILDLMQNHQLATLIADPNPWKQVPDTAEKLRHFKAHEGRSGARLRPVAIGPNTTFHGNGSPATTYSYSLPSHCPSLIEMTLSRISKLQGSTAFADLVDEAIPDSVHQLLLRAHDQELDGGAECSTCRRSIVIPRAQRVEWWSIDFPRSGPFLTLPFLRTQCHQYCSSLLGDSNRNWCDSYSCVNFPTTPGGNEHADMEV